MRLTKAMRDEIAHAVLAHKFDGSEEKRLDEKFRLLCDEIYEDLVLERFRVIMDTLPESFFVRTNSFTCHRTGSDVWEDRMRLTMSHARPLPAFLQHHQPVPSRALVKRWDNLEKEKDALKHNRDQLRIKIKSVLASVNTVKQLLETWPEVEPFLPKVSCRNLPAVPLTDLNKELGLS